MFGKLLNYKRCTHIQNARKKDDPILAEDSPAWEKSCFTNDTLIDISSLLHRITNMKHRVHQQTQWKKICTPRIFLRKSITQRTTARGAINEWHTAKKSINLKINFPPLSKKNRGSFITLFVFFRVFPLKGILFLLAQ